MGDLPTPDDLANGRFAKPEDYKEAKEIITNSLTELYRDYKIYGASIYGSSINGEVRLGSDLDVFVTAYSITAAQRGLQLLRTEVEKRYVPIEINPLISTRQSFEGKHGMELDFMAYLKLAMTNQTIIGNNPLKILKERPVKIPSHLELIMHEEGNLRRLTRDCTAPQFSTSHCKFLSRMLNYALFAPKELYYIKYDGLPESRILSKPELVELYKKEFPQANPEFLDKAIFFWNEIKSMFNKDPVNVNDYKDLLGWFNGLYDEYEAFARQNIDLIKDMLIGQKPR